VGVGVVACAAHAVSTAIKATLKFRRAIEKTFVITHRKKICPRKSCFIASVYVFMCVALVLWQLRIGVNM
jgi:hypothetical protein